jgi:GMP synthase-like glutamine amidotransferase
MKVGLVNLYRTPKGIQPLLSICRALGLTVELHTPEPTIDLSELIRTSPIQHWIFSGSDRSVKGKGAPQVPLGSLSIPGKQILCICYSMESVLVQEGYPLVRREKKKGTFLLHGQEFYRNHYAFVPSAAFKRGPAKLVESLDGEAMTATLKNATLVQWHPERSPDGVLFLVRWFARAGVK